MCTESAPKVSVLTPIYNTNTQHLREMIESILGQTFTDFEFLILNDSPDNTEIEEIVKSYASKDKRIKYHKNEKNIGISESRNKLLDLACGEYIAIFDHDDISVPERLEKEVAYLDSHPSVGVVSGWIEYFGDDNSIAKNPRTDTEIKTWLTFNCFVAHTATMIRKSILIDNNIKYEEEFTPAEDYQLWYRLMGVTMFYNIQEVLVRYRWHATNTSELQNNKREKARDLIACEMRTTFPAYWNELKRLDEPNITLFRLKLFGFIPLIKIKHNWIQLFEFIPLFKIKRK